MSGDSFLSRWSKRKGADKPETLPTPAAANVAINVSADTSIDGQFAAKMPEIADQTDTLPTAPAIKKPLPPVESLNTQSDFTPFMANDVSPQLRNQAMKLLFTDPHYNVMDRLDIYIDDYGKPDPLPADWLKKMNQSKTLRLFDDEEQGEVAGKMDIVADTTLHDGPVVREQGQPLPEGQDAIPPGQDTGQVDATTAGPGRDVEVKSKP